MAAPTSFRVESSSPDTVILYWVGGSGNIGVYISTDGSSYSLVTLLDTGTLTYTATGLNSATFYYFKLSDDGGSTFSAVATVKTQSCSLPTGALSELQLPRVGSEVDAGSFNQLSQRVEEFAQSEISAPEDCTVCTVDGALVMDCTQGCIDFIVNATEDINSISLLNCAQDGSINFLIPPSTTRMICGWAGGFGFTGDECFHNAITSGVGGKTVTVSYRGNRGGTGGRTKTSPTSNRGYGGGGGGVGATCMCVPGKVGQLTIKCCTANCSLGCSGSKSLTLKACGGQAPYTWSRTGTVTLQVGDNGATGSSAIGGTIIVKPPTNTGSGTAGTAYTAVKQYCYCQTSGACSPVCGPINGVVWTDYGCNDQVITNNNADYTADQTGCGAGFGQCVPGTCGTCATCICSGGACSGNASYPTAGTAGSALLPVTGGTTTCDKRSGAMISAGCVPCGVNNGAVITVTDNLGTSTSITLKA